MDHASNRCFSQQNDISLSQVEWSCLAGDCLLVSRELERGDGFHRIFTSNVADHVGIPSLVLAFRPLLAQSGWLLACLSTLVQPSSMIDCLHRSLNGMKACVSEATT